jgi:hypothetical protein
MPDGSSTRTRSPSMTEIASSNLKRAAETKSISGLPAGLFEDDRICLFLNVQQSTFRVRNRSVPYSFVGVETESPFSRMS